MQIDFYADFDGSFHKLLGVDLDLSVVLLGPRSHRYSLHYNLQCSLPGFRPAACMGTAYGSSSVRKWKSMLVGIVKETLVTSCLPTLVKAIVMFSYCLPSLCGTLALVYRWAAVVEDGTIKAFEVEKTPSDMDLTSADNILKHL